MNILEKIIAKKEKEVAKLKRETFSQVKTGEIPTLREKVTQEKKMSIIAEIKRASPSKGPIYMDVDPVLQAKEYERLGAAAISVLTDEPFFHGSMEDLQAVRKEVKLPILCKDFIIDPVQIDRAKAAGANIILLIVAALDQDTLQRLYHYAKQLALEVLVEVHDEAEMERALALGAKIIGVNNRDLKSFTVDLVMTEKLAAMVTDPDVIFVSESGIRTKADVETIAKTKAKVILVGETLMRSADLASTFKELRVPLQVKEKTKDAH